LERADELEQLAILDASIQGSCQVVVDISSRFIFESSVFEARQTRDLSIDEFSRLMLDSQRQTYGDGLDQNLLHPYMWAAKGHYYSSPFYNFPYMFGLLFGLGLYSRYQQDPDGFRAGYDELLSSTGLADAATLAGRFGYDIRAPEFWTSSLDIVRDSINRFEKLVDAAVAGQS
ncbi:MAG: M3 family oligoendopeptidase, partial [Chloroflexota bacterium]